MNDILEDVLSVSEAARMTDRTEAGIRRAITRRRLRARKVGRVWILDRTDLLAYIVEANRFLGGRAR